MFFTPILPLGRGLFILLEECAGANDGALLGPGKFTAAARAGPILHLPNKTLLIAEELAAAALGSLFPLGIKCPLL